MRALILVAVASFITAWVSATAIADDAAAAVKLTQKEGAVEIHIDGQPFTTYNHASSQPKPYFYPVYGPAGKEMTYMFPATRPEGQREYHPHQKSLWIAVDEVNDVRFWAEKGKIANQGVEVVKNNQNPAVFRSQNHWLDEEGQPVLEETTTISIYANRLMAYEIKLRAADGPVKFGDTKEGFFGVRLNPQLRESTGNGVITNADGMKGEKECWGKRCRWVDYSGKIDGVPAGIAVFDHPDNFRPARWHVRGYGLFAASPFGEHAYSRGSEPDGTHTIAKGDTLTLKYAVYFHAGDATKGEVADAYVSYLKAAP